MNVYIINFYAITFDNGDEGTRFTVKESFKTYDAAVEYVKNKFIPSIIKETKDFYPDEEIDVKVLYEDNGCWTLGTFDEECNEQIEAITIEINKVILNN